MAAPVAVAANRGERRGARQDIRGRLRDDVLAAM